MKNNQIEANEAIRPMREICVLSHDEQRSIVQNSYQNPYGIFIRVAMFTGMSAEELAGASWSDLDAYYGRIRIQSVRQTVKGEPCMKQAYAPRFVPLLPHVLQELLAWRETQRHICADLPPIYASRLPIATAMNGHPLVAENLLEGFFEILQACGLPSYPFYVLRDTFAARSLEQGMDPQTLNIILGDPNAATIYASYIANCDSANRALMETLYTAPYAYSAEIFYPVLVAPLENKSTLLYSPDFPEASCYTDNLVEGLREIRDRMEDDLHNSYYPPMPTVVSSIPCRPNEFIIQMHINL